MYKVTHLGAQSYRILHYAQDDPNPTPTSPAHSDVTGAPRMWEVVLGRAAKMSLMLRRPQLVELHDGRRYLVNATQEVTQ